MHRDTPWDDTGNSRTLIFAVAAAATVFAEGAVTFAATISK